MTDMDTTEFVEAIRDETKTELSRLGSSKSLYADTEGEMEPDAVLTAAADDATEAADTFEDWRDGEAGETFAAAADREREHADAVTDKLDAYDRGETPAIVGFLRGQDETVARLGALVGWTLAIQEKVSQCSGFFTGQADPRTASLFRGFGEDYEDTREAALAALAEHCENDEDWAAAAAAATGAIEAAYDEYFETLEALGVNPKPVC
jgi:hypothetical protein